MPDSVFGTWNLSLKKKSLLFQGKKINLTSKLHIKLEENRCLRKKKRVNKLKRIGVWDQEMVRVLRIGPAEKA